MNAENEASPAMKIFSWRGPSRSDVTAEEIAVPSSPDLVPAQLQQPAALLELGVEVRLAGAVVRVGQGVSGGQLTEVLCAVRRSACRFELSEEDGATFRPH